MCSQQGQEDLPIGAGGYLGEAGAKTHGLGKERSRLGLRQPDRWLHHPRYSPELHPSFPVGVWGEGPCECQGHRRRHCPVDLSVVMEMLSLPMLPNGIVGSHVWLLST